MMFKNKFVVCIKANGKILREFKDVVKLPFGTEFTILLKNLNTVRAQVSVAIDGTDVTENVYLVINPNSEMELTRYIKNGNLNQGNAFKFIEMTEGIANHRGVKAEDGLVRVQIQFEKPVEVDDTDEVLKRLEQIQRDLDRKADKGDVWPRPYYYYPVLPYNPPSYPYPYPYPYHPPLWNQVTCGSFTSAVGGSLTSTSNGTVGSVSNTGSLPVAGNASTAFLNTVQAQNSGGILRGASFDGATLTTSSNSMLDCDAGITVPGSESNQKFSMVGHFEVETEVHVIILKLVGVAAGGVQYVAPVTVKAKPKCQSCGRVNKATSKFCTDCGTALVIL